MNWYKHYLGDYARDTGDLSIAEHGAYRLLLDHYYATEGKIPVTVTALQRLCRATTELERAAVDTVADRFFAVNGDGSRHNTRADEEIAKCTAHAAHNREIGKLGGRPPKPVRVNSGFPPDNPYGTPIQTPDTRLPDSSSTTTARPAKRARPPETRTGLTLNVGKVTFDGLDDAEVLAWQEMFPAISVGDQISRAASWCIANPARGRKSNYRRFLHNWLSRAQDRGAPTR
jgi:uncharacterized protein YdaU (DUF1376 family)